MVKPPDCDSRGQSEVLGVVLLLGITILGVGALVVIGGSAITGIQEQATLEEAELSFSNFDSRASRVALGQSPVQKLDLGVGQETGSGTLAARDGGWIRITVTNTSTGNSTPIMNRTLGSVVYESGETTIAYQSGGVWKQTGGDTTMVSPPEFHYRDGTLTMPVVTVDSDSTLDDELVVRSNDASKQEFPNENTTNPLMRKRIDITIKSQFYEGWGSYFEQRTDGGTKYDHDAGTVTISLLNPGEPNRIDAGMIIRGGGGKFRIQSGKNSVIDGYNSSAISPNLGPDSPPEAGGNADIRTDKDIRFDGQAQVSGNLTTSGSISFKGNPNRYRIEGNLRYGTGSVSEGSCEDYVGGTCSDDVGDADLPESIDTEIQGTITNLRSSADTNDNPCFTENNAVTFDDADCGSTVELDAGDYYTRQNLQVSNGEKLVLNTTDGEIRIGVDNDQSIQFQGANVTVVGDGTVRIFGTKEYRIEGSNTIVWNRGWDANQLWLYCSMDCQVFVQNNPTFNGVVYAPSAPGGNAQVRINGGNTEVYGAIVGGGQTELKSNADIHFDRSLRYSRPFEQRTAPSIAYLHISVNSIEVESSD